jgi:hypothetical protein
VTHERAVQDSVKIALNLDTIERQDKDGKVTEPFRFVVAGRMIQMRDPQEIDWQDMLRIAADVSSLFAFAMSREDYLFFKRQNFPMWKMDRLVTAYQEHYGLDLRMAATTGNGPGSRT